MIQIMPGADEETISKIEEQLKRHQESLPS